MIKKNNIPNFLSISRIILAIVSMPLFLINSTELYGFQIFGLSYSFTISWFIGSIIFLIAVITDFVDGYLARKYNWISDFGKVVDPIADKILVNCIMIILTYLKIVPIWVTLIFIIRDTSVDSFRIMLANKKENVAANWWGKIKTILQMLGLIMVLFIFNSNVYTHIIYHLIQNLVLYFSSLFSLVSGFIYIRKAIKVIKK